MTWMRKGLLTLLWIALATGFGATAWGSDDAETWYEETREL